MNCIIIDDEEGCREVLKQLVSQVNYLNLVAVCNGPIEAIATLTDEQIDLALLDIEMPGMTGLDMFNSITMPPTILTTSHKEYALDAFEHNIVDYLIKPIDQVRFMKAIEKAKGTHNKLNVHNGPVKDYFFLKKDSVMHKVPTKEVLWVEALGDYLAIHTINGKYVLHLTLKAMLAKLPPDKFIRVHRSYIVNIDNIGKVEGANVFINNVSIPIGALHGDNFFKALNLL